MGSEPCNFTGKHVLVTGGAMGIGLELCKVAQQRGAASLTILDISEAALSSSAELLEESGNAAVHTFKADVGKYEQVLHAVQTAHQLNGGLDIIFANAGIGSQGHFWERDPAFFEKVMNVNYMGVVHTLKAALPILSKQKSGYIMVTNSIAGFAGTRGLSAYCASKFAVRGLIETMRLEMVGSGINFYQAAPNFVNTDMMRNSLASAAPNQQMMFRATVPKLGDANEVAEKMIAGMEVGRYIVRSPDHIADFIIKGCLTPSMPRYNGLIVDMLLAPFYVWIHHEVARQLNLAADIFIHGKPPPAKSKVTWRSILFGALAMAAISMAAARFAKMV